MIFTDSELSALNTALYWWEFGEYASGAVVIIGCVGEFIAGFTDCLTGGEAAKKHKLSKLSLIVLMIGLTTGLTCLMLR